MKLITQPAESNICTQCSVAMLGNIELNQSFELFGHSNSSNLGQAWKVLQKLGYKEYYFKAKVDNRRRIPLEGRGLLAIGVKGTPMGHAVAFNDGKIYDPGGYIFDSLAHLQAHYMKQQNRKWLVREYLRVMQ